MTLTPKDVRLNAFMTNLENDFIAVSQTGEVLARADTEDAVRRAVPDAAAYFSGAEFKDIGATAEMVGSATTLDEALETLTDAVEDVKKTDLDGDGRIGGAPKGGNRKRKPK